MDFRKIRRGALCAAGLSLALTPAVCQSTHSQLTSYIDGTGGQHIFYVNSTPYLNQLFYNGGVSWIGQNLNQLYGAAQPESTTASLASVLGLDGSQRVFYVDPIQHVDVFSYIGGTAWLGRDLIGTYGGNNAVAGSAITAYQDNIGGIHVVYLDANQGVNQIFSNGASWVPQDLTVLYANGPTANKASALTSFADPFGDQYIFYLVNDANTDLVYFGYAANTNMWSLQNVTINAAGNKPTAGSALASFIDPFSLDEHVFYLDSNQHLNQAFYSFSAQTWTLQDLTATYGGNTPAAGSSLAAWEDSFGGQHVAYLDSNSDLNQLFYEGGTSWLSQNLTALYGGNAPNAGSALTAYVDDAGGQHVAYLDSSQNLNQLFYVGGTIWSAQNLTGAYGGSTPALRTVSTLIR